MDYLVCRSEEGIFSVGGKSYPKLAGHEMLVEGLQETFGDRNKWRWTSQRHSFSVRIFPIHQGSLAQKLGFDWEGPPFKENDLNMAAPPWSLVLIFSAAPIYGLLIRTRRSSQARRHRRGLCHRCKYSLTGNTTGTCPECGTPIKTP